MTTLSPQAVRALIDLEHGAVFNCMTTIARVLISEGYAFDGWGKLEITEMGRRAARTFRSFVADDPNISNMGDLNEPRFETPLNSHNVPDPDFVVVPEAPEPEPATMNIETKRGGQNFELPDLVNERRDLSWSKSRVMAAAGVANGKTGIWVDQAWIAAFIEAYEG